ncbi:hypothetical protein LARI1_G001238 [Lachnellula arida]|uniref:Uncharacterized protein n=1 Tax=Lachnellula arida TaxID=1316785 RepID=A0A8T9BNU0_9HELO|nr:hypothetical protein LARI1_G001238 [Lachnellula arida]
MYFKTKGKLTAAFAAVWRGQSFVIGRWMLRHDFDITTSGKNFLIIYKTPISLILRALVFPIVVALIFNFLKHIGESGSSYDEPFGISATSFPVKDLPDAMKAASKHRLVFVRN